MKEKGKAVDFSDFDEMPCQKHPNTSPVGICPYCLKERLVKLVCSECGEQRLSSCSCSDVSSSYRNSCSTMEVGSVGRVSFLLENDKVDLLKSKRSAEDNNSKQEQVIFLRRSSSSCVEVKKNNGFWKIKRLFRKKKKGEFCDEKSSEVWVSDIMGVSRSRSLCSFRGTVRYSDADDEYAFSSAKISDVTNGVFVDDSEPRKSGLDRVYSVPNRGVFPAKESDFTAMDESAFIDLKLDLGSEPRVSGASDNGGGMGFENYTGWGLKNSGGSCRNHKKVWKWIFKYHKKKEICKS